METQKVLYNNFSQFYPSLLTRFQSILIDGLAIFILTCVIAGILNNVEGMPDGVRVAVLFIVWGTYEPLCTAFGKTLGNHVMNLRVRRYENRAEKISIFQAYVRFLTKLALGWLSFITIHMNEQKRAIHDFTGGSIVVQYTPIA